MSISSSHSSLKLLHVSSSFQPAASAPQYTNNNKQIIINVAIKTVVKLKTLLSGQKKAYASSFN
jgi:hypothetical protein